MTGLPVDRNIPSGSRVSDRISTEETATIFKDNSSFTITILDLGLEGFGVLSERPLDKDEEIYLEVPDEFGIERYTCEVSFCKEEPDGFHIGLVIIDCEDDIVLIDETSSY
jgi:hypothetical protein